jgi:hypothetical protein
MSLSGLSRYIKYAFVPRKYAFVPRQVRSPQLELGCENDATVELSNVVNVFPALATSSNPQNPKILSFPSTVMMVSL